MRLLFVRSVAAAEHLDELSFSVVLHTLLRAAYILDFIGLEVAWVEELVTLSGDRVGLELRNTSANKGSQVTIFATLVVGLGRRLLLE